MHMRHVPCSAGRFYLPGAMEILLVSERESKIVLEREWGVGSRQEKTKNVANILFY